MKKARKNSAFSIICKNFTASAAKLVMLVAMVCACSGVWALDLTVANGTGTNDEIPFYGLYADDNYQHTQTIYPANMLTDMQGGQIKKLTYYLSNAVTQDYGSTFEVRIGTTNSTSFSSGTVNYISLISSPVWSGNISLSSSRTLVFDFTSNPYTYTGGNLVVDVRITSLASGYQGFSFYGESGSTYYSVKDRSTSSLPTTSGSAVSFMPKTTFTYTTSGGGGSSDCDTENFSGYTAVDYDESTYYVPTGWHSYNNSNSGFAPRVSDEDNYSFIDNRDGNYLLLTINGKNNNRSAFAILPMYSGIFSVSFKYIYENTGKGALTVGYVTNNSGYDTYQVLATPTKSGDWVSYSLTSADIETINSNNGYIAFRYRGNADDSYYSVAIDDIEICTLSSPHTVTWSVDGSTSIVSTAALTNGQVPSNPTISCGGKVFVGWTTSPISGSQVNAPSPLYSRSDLVGTSVAADVTYYAVFADVSSGAPVNTTLWSETWTGGTDNQVIGDYAFGGTTVWNGQALTYTSSTSENVIKNGNNAGGEAPELFIKKGGSNNCTFSNIPTGGATEMTFNFYSNRATNGYTLTSTTTGISISAITGNSNPRTCTITATGGVSSFNLILTNTSNGNNARFDNFELSAEIPSTIYTNYVTSCVTTTYTVTYNANGGTGNVPTDANSPYNSGSTVTVLGNIGSPALSKTGYVFGGWNTQADGNGTTYAAGDNFTINANTTLYALWLSSYTVTWSIDGSTTTQNYPIAGSYALALPSAVATAAASHDCYGRVFVGWTANPSWSSDNPPADLFRIPTGNVSANTTYYAVFAYESGVAPAWSLVENPSLLAVGDKVVIAAKDYDFAMSTEQRTSNRNKAEITKSDYTITWTSSVCEFDLRAGTTSGTWAFYDASNSGYIYAASSSANQLKTKSDLDANGSWSISISSGTASITAQGTNSRKVMQYNNGSGIFACYASASQQAVSIYRYAQTYIGYTTNCTPCTEPALSLSAASGSVSVDGTINLALTNPNNTDVTWTSSNPLVATVSGTNTGVIITGVNVGSATITANIPAAHVGGTYYCPASVTYDVTVSCNPYTVPVCFDFDGFASPTDDEGTDTGVPSCWRRIYSGTESGYEPHVYNGVFAMDDNGIVMTSGDDDGNGSEYYYFGNHNYLVMPYVDGLGEGDVIEFNAWWEKLNSGTLVVGYMTNPNDASTFTSIGTAASAYYYGGSSSTGHNEFSIPAGMPSGAYLAFEWNYQAPSGFNYYSVVIDNVCIDHACTPRSGNFYFTHTSETLIEGSTLDISTYLINTAEPSGTVVWTSSNTAVATVVNGVVTAGTEEGIAHITARIPKATISGTYYCDVEAVFTVAVSDGCITIGSGSSTTGYAPLYGYYKRSYSQMIYTAAEVGGIGTINKISFHSNAINTQERTVKVYIGMTDKTEFADDNDFIPVASMTQVWGGNTGRAWNITEGWNEFELTTPFDYYDETKNIVVAVYSTAANYERSNFYYTGKANYMTIAAYDDSSDPAPGISNWATYGGSKVRNYYTPNIKFCINTENVLQIDYVVNTSSCTGVVTSVVPSTYAFRGRAVNVSSREPICSNGVFLGWCTTENGAVVYTAGQSIDGGLTENKVLYAKYHKCDYVDVSRADSDPNKGQGVGDGIFDDEGIMKFNVCMGDNLTLLASRKPWDGENGVHDNVTLSYKWYVSSHDGAEHAYSTANPYTFEVNNVLGYAMGQDVLLVVEASDGCHEEIPLRVWMSKGLEVSGSANLDNLCVGDAKLIHVGADVTEHSIEVPDDDVRVSASMGESVETFIPDGQDCEDEHGYPQQFYTSTVHFSDFKENTRITSVDNINYVRINMEHSFIGDIQVKITCPDGREAIILEDYGNPSGTPTYGVDDFGYEWPDPSDDGLYRVYFGEPDLYDVFDDVDYLICDKNDPHNISGVGYDYAWSNSSLYPNVGHVYQLINLSDETSRYNNGTLETTNFYHVKESDVATKTQIYAPFQSFDNLVGCHLNGDWTISVSDSWKYDNGYIFEWEISLEDIDNNEWEYEVTAVNSQIGTCAGSSQGLVSEVDGTADFNVTPTLANIEAVAQALGLPSILDVPLNCELTIVDNIGCHSNPYGFQYTIVQSVVPEINAPDICTGNEISVTAELGGNVIDGGNSVFRWYRSYGEGGIKVQLGPTIYGETSATLSGYIATTTDSIYWAEIYDHNGCGGEIQQAITINGPDRFEGAEDYAYIWKGGTVGSTQDWDIPTNWYTYTTEGGVNRWVLTGGSLPNESDNVYIGSPYCTSNSAPELSSNISVHNLTIANAASITDDGNTINMYGDWENNGTYTATGKVMFTGADAEQKIKGSQTTAFNNIEINKSSGKVKVDTEPIINGEATFTKGIVEGNATFAETASVHQPANLTYNSFVDGTVTRATSAAGEFTFPTGSGSVLGTVTASLPASSSTDVTFYHTSGTGYDMPEAGLCSDNNPHLDHVSGHEYWKVNTSTALASSTLKLSSANQEDHFSTGATTYEGEHIYGVILQGGCWKTISNTPSEVNGGHNTITISGVTIPAVATRAAEPQPMSIGSTERSTLLPIELTSFSATCDGRSSLVEWTTATEKNNDFFSLERSDDAINFVEIARIAGAGNSIVQLSYSYTDYGVYGGDNYYRLVQVDYDGTRTASEIIVANCVEASGEPEVLAYPNPFSGDLTVELENFGDRPASIEVYDVLGRLLYVEQADAPQNSYQTVLHLSDIPSSTYTVRVSTSDFVINRKVVKN